ncbi:DUF2993 domain-containing protein [Lysinibacter sp. HNR]|uniref:LmeA family phospholipid-binding protein n=1 Tax=Lysinibacter sp. HNR TaxID=3031408 RepID=UPI002435A261|nr:DUF2993 domain-containing protein [Lysinibacter sp. HNR]WGD36857.1 DUF2993 domain-containing protein [Lysinibacter sp. HNR]
MNRGVKRLLISLGVVAVLGGILAGALAVIDPWVRDRVEDAVGDAIVSQLGGASGGQIEVTTGGFMMIPQVLSGKLDDVTVSLEGATVGEGRGDVTLTLKGLPAVPTAPFESGTMSVTMDSSAIADVIGKMDTAAIGEVTVEDGLLRVSRTQSVLRSEIQIDVWLSVSAQDNNLVLAPVRIAVNGSEISSEDAVARFGGVAALGLEPRSVCVAQFFPRGLTLTSLEQSANEYTFNFTVAPNFISDSAQRELGSCG